MLKNNCQCEVCRSVWGAGAHAGEPAQVEGGNPIIKKHSVGSGLATQVVTLILLVSGFISIVDTLPGGMWYTWPGAVLLAALATFPVAHTSIAILNTLEALYENN